MSPSTKAAQPPQSEYPNSPLNRKPLDPKVTAIVEAFDGSYRVTLRTLKYNYVVEGWYNGVLQIHYGTTDFHKAKLKFNDLRESALTKHARKNNDAIR